MIEWLMIMIKLIDLILTLIFVCHMYCNGDPNKRYGLAPFPCPYSALSLAYPYDDGSWTFFVLFSGVFPYFPQDPYGWRPGKMLSRAEWKKVPGLWAIQFCCVFCEMIPRILVINLTFRVKLKAWFTPTRGDFVASTREAKFSVTREGRPFWRPILAPVISAAAAS